MGKLKSKSILLTLYSLSQESLGALTELGVLEKKIILGSNLINKVDDKALISKLEKEKEEFEKQRKSLNILIKKLESISGSIGDFTLFFIFIRRFHKLAIKKVNFEDNNKTVSSKLIYKLQGEEERLYNEYVEGNCFSKVLKILSFESYQCYFQEFAKKFFDNIQGSSDPYVNLLLILKAVLYECSFFCTDKIGDFILTDIMLFLSKNIPHQVVLPSANYELVALRCFFYYEILKEYLKLKSVKNYLANLKKSITLELNILNYNSYNKEILILGMYDLQESINKIEKKYIDFLRIKSEDNESDINKSLIFFKILISEIQVINTKTKNLINDKYTNLIKMRRLLAIFSNESHLPKFLEVFYIKIGNDFVLNEMMKTETIETNKEALGYLFHVICKDKLFAPLNPATNLFIEKMTAGYSLNDIFELENIELEDLIEFSFYYIFTLIYTDFNSHLNGINTKLLYTEFITFNRLINIKFEALEILEETINERIGIFLEKTFKIKEEYCQHKKNILDEIKLNLEVMQGIERILSDAKILETELNPRLKLSSIPMPEENLLMYLSKKIKKKQSACEAECQKIEKHQFVNKSKSEKITTNDGNLETKKQLENNKLIELISESLICLAKNLEEILKYLKERTQDANQFRQKISFAMDQLSSSINKLTSSINDWGHINKTYNLANLSLIELLRLIDEVVIKNTLIKRKNYKKKLTQLTRLLNNSCSSIDLLVNQVNIIFDKYQNYNNESKKLLKTLSASFMEDNPSSLFFSKSKNKKIPSQIFEELNKNYFYLSEQFFFLEKIIRIVKSDDNKLIELLDLVIEADEYQKALKHLNKKIDLFKKDSAKSKNSKKNRRFKNEDKTKITIKKVACPSTSSKLVTEKNIVNSIPEEKQIQFEDIAIAPSSISLSSNEQEVETFKISKEIGSCLESKAKLPGEVSLVSSLVTTVPEQSVSNLINVLEEGQKEFEIWKDEKNFQLLDLFNIIESSTLAILRNGSSAFLKILAYHYQELIDKSTDLTSQKERIMYLSEVETTDLLIKYLMTQEQWLYETKKRIVNCSERVKNSFQNNENLTEISSRSLLTEYLKLTIYANNSRKLLIDEEEKLSLLYSSFTKQVLPANSLQQMQKMGTVPELSMQIDKVNQLKVDRLLVYKNKQEILSKLLLIAPDKLKYVNLIDPFYMENMDENSTNLEISSGGDSAMLPPVQLIPRPSTLYYLPLSAIYPADAVQSSNQIFHPM